MALSDKNIVITPNIGSSSDPKIVFSGADASTGAQNITLQVYPTNSGTLSFEGSAGQLFSISNTMTGTIFSANDVSGIPSIEVLDNGLVKLAQYSGNVVLGTGLDNSSDKLQVTGSIKSTTNITAAGQLISTVASGTAPLVVSSSTVVNNLNAQYWNGNIFSNYLNQSVLTSSSPTFSNVYSNDWFRNNSNNTGLYNQNNATHFYTSGAQTWDLAGGTDANAITVNIRSSHQGTVRGRLYGEGEWFGLLNRAGEWALRHRQTDGYSPNWWFLESGNESWTGDPGSDEGKIEYHANRFYIAAGNNSDRIVQFRRSGSDVSYIDNSGVYQGTASYATSAGSASSASSASNATTANGANGNFYIDDNYGNTIVGVYDSYRYQGVFAMGDSYKLPADGTGTGSLYGLAWSHPNAGGAAGNLTDHGLLVINNGGFRCAISNSIVASGNITAYSDERLKTNWRNMPENYVSRLAEVKVGIYDRTDEENSTQVGVSAQSFQKLLPEAIMTAKDEMQTLSVNYGSAALASAVELAKDNVELRKRIERLEKIIESLISKE